MHVIVWGPHADAKRQAIIDDLRLVPETEVATPEELLAGIPELASLGDDVWFQEEIQATSADMVVCLVKNGPTGAPAEITKFKDHVHIGAKIRLLRPKALAHPDAVLLDAVKRFPAVQSKQYTPAQLIQCRHIRAQCREWLSAIRREKFRKSWRESHPVE